MWNVAAISPARTGDRTGGFFPSLFCSPRLMILRPRKGKRAGTHATDPRTLVSLESPDHERLLHGFWHLEQALARSLASLILARSLARPFGMATTELAGYSASPPDSNRPVNRFQSNSLGDKIAARRDGRLWLKNDRRGGNEIIRVVGRNVLSRKSAR